MKIICVIVSGGRKQMTVINIKYSLCSRLIHLSVWCIYIYIHIYIYILYYWIFMAATFFRSETIQNFINSQYILLGNNYILL